MLLKVVVPIFLESLLPSLTVRKQVAVLQNPTWQIPQVSCWRWSLANSHKKNWSSQTYSPKELNAANTYAIREADNSPVEPPDDAAALDDT